MMPECKCFSPSLPHPPVPAAWMLAEASHLTCLRLPPIHSYPYPAPKRSNGSSTQRKNRNPEERAVWVLLPASLCLPLFLCLSLLQPLASLLFPEHTPRKIVVNSWTNTIIPSWAQWKSLGKCVPPLRRGGVCLPHSFLPTTHSHAFHGACREAEWILVSTCFWVAFPGGRRGLKAEK